MEKTFEANAVLALKDDRPVWIGRKIWKCGRVETNIWITVGKQMCLDHNWIWIKGDAWDYVKSKYF